MFEIIAWGVVACVALSLVGFIWTVHDPQRAHPLARPRLRLIKELQWLTMKVSPPND